MRPVILAFSVVAIALIGTYLIGEIDATYQTVKHSYDSSKEKHTHHELKSPEREQYHLLLNNHWKVSPVFSFMEDLFYPFREWRDGPAQAIKFSGDYQYFNDQLASIKMIEKATKVRAMRAYFFAKRKNFKDAALNNDFINKNNQWLSTFKELIERKVNLMNGTYDNQWIVCIGVVVLFGVFAILAPFNQALLGLVCVMASLFFGSFYHVLSYGIPFHWFLIVLLCAFRGVDQFKPNEKALLTGAFILLIIVGISPTIYMAVGVFSIILIWGYPKIRRGVYMVLWLHPLGAWYVLQKERQFKSIAIIWVGALCLLWGGNMLNVDILLTSPIAYLGHIGAGLNTVILMMVSACIMMDCQDKISIRYVNSLSGSIIGIIFVKTIWGSPLLFQWAFYFLWNPMIQWGSVITLSVFLLKHMKWSTGSARVMTSVDQRIVK